MGNRKRLCSLLVFVVIGVGICSPEAYQFNVGGKDGWVLNPSENYNNWAQRMRFQVNDTLFFKYKKGSDSVLVVGKGDYDTCNTQKPITKLDGGDSVFKFDRSGPFYFISGNKTNCDKGQKLIIVVLAVRNTPPKSPPSSPTPSPSSAPSPGSGTGSPVPAAGPGAQSQPPPSSFSPPAPDAPGPGGSTGNINSTAPPHGAASLFRPSVAMTSSVIVLLLSTGVLGSYVSF